MSTDLTVHVAEYDSNEGPSAANNDVVDGVVEVDPHASTGLRTVDCNEQLQSEQRHHHERCSDHLSVAWDQYAYWMQSISNIDFDSF